MPSRSPSSSSSAPASRRSRARDVAAFIPDCAILFKRLVRDPRVPRRAKVALWLVLPYLASPFDLIPDFIPVLGHVDDALVVAAAVAYVARTAGRDVIEELWPGSAAGLRVVLALAPAESAHSGVGERDLGVGGQLQPEADEDGDLRG
jgi:uncharacterized membrane protein YkvA (DUF1232 family)